MDARRYVALIATLLACIATADAQSLRVLYAEPFQPIVEGDGSNALSKTAATRRLRLQSFGRRFDLALSDNNALLRAAQITTTQRDTVTLFKGTVVDAPGSWVRLALIDGQYEGAFWDGSDLYAIAPRAAIESDLITPLATSTSNSLIYRLSDTQGGLLEGTCATSDASAQTAVSRYRNLVQELRAAFAEKPSATNEVSVAMVADFEFVSRMGTRAISSLITRANVVDGIFSDQVGISIVPTDFVTYSTDSDSFTSSDAPTLLNQLADFKQSRNDLSGRGIVHLVTGRQLDGSTVGIAFLNSVCHSRAGSSLSESSTSIDSALIMAHEIGHNLGARHDGEAGSPCSTTPQQYLMAPAMNHSATLSACSVQSIRTALASASCVVPTRDRDVEITVPAQTVNGTVDQPLELHADVRALTEAGAANISVTAQTSSLQIQTATLGGALCNISFNQANCLVPQLAFGESARLTVTLLPRYTFSGTATFTVDALNDSNTANDRSQVAVTVSNARDIQIDTEAPEQTILGEPFDVKVDVRSSGVLPLEDVHALIETAQQQVVSATVEGGTDCTIETWRVNCALGEIAAGTAKRITLRMISRSPGRHFHPVNVQDRGVAPALNSYEPFFINTVTARDLAVEFVPTNRRIAVGLQSEWAINVRSHGVYAVSGARLQIQQSSLLANVSIGFPQSCLQVDALIECELGTLAPGATLSVPITVRGDVVGENGGVEARLLQVAADDVPWNDNSTGYLEVVHATEISLNGAFVDRAYDLVQTRLSTYIASFGANAVQGATATVTFPSGFRIVSGSVGQTRCAVRTDAEHIATCALPDIDYNQVNWLYVDYVAPVPGTFVASVTVAAAGDADATNNEALATIEVLPYVDAQLLNTPTSAVQLSTTPFDLSFTASTNRHVSPSATFAFEWYGPIAQVSATWQGGSCEATVSPLRCDLGDLAANTSTAITVRVTPQRAGEISVYARLHSMAEVQHGNNSTYASFSIVEPTDVSLVSTQTTFTAVPGQALSIPGLSITSAGNVPNVQIEIDTDSTLIGAITFHGGSCFASSLPVRCTTYLYSMMPLQISLRVVPAGAGSIPIKMRVVAINDSTPQNNEVLLTVAAQAVTPPEPPPTVVPPPAAPAASGGGKGGGGGVEWPLVAILLGLLAIRVGSTRRRRSL